MKKSLVLAMAMALGVTASAYAANPFSDVPAGHWAYDSINQLVDAGVIDGYGDGTFGGDRLMTRYEMAQIVAKAMAKGANVDRLAAEFADELDSLGVRVAKLEKKADNVKITGQIRYSYDHEHKTGANSTILRSRIWIAGQVNDNWTYTGMLQNQQYFSHNNNEDSQTDFQRAWVDGRIGGVKVQAGRYNFTDFMQNRGYIHDSRFDGIQLAYGKDVKVTVGGGKISDSVDRTLNVSQVQTAVNASSINGGHAYYVDVTGKLGKYAGANVSYYRVQDLTGTKFGKSTPSFIGEDVNLFTVGVSFKLAKDVKLMADYLHSDLEGSAQKSGAIVGLAYAGAKANKPGSWGIYAKYLNQPAGSTWNTTMPQTAGNAYPRTGMKGAEVGVSYAFAKNMIGTVTYYNLKAQNGNDADGETLWSQLVFTF